MTGPLVAIVIVLLAAAIFALVARKIMERLGVAPAEPEERSAGLGDVLGQLRAWLERRRSAK